MNVWDVSSVEKSVVDRGITEWKTIADEQEREIRALIAEVERCLDAEPWGTGTEGRAFAASHMGADGPLKTISQCKNLLKEIGDIGDAVRIAVDNMLEAHAQGAADMRGAGRKVMEV
jgi:hypothetical protein